MPYQVSRNGSNLGTFTRAQLSTSISEGTLLLSDHIWRDGMHGWVTILEKGILHTNLNVPSFWDTLPDGSPLCSCSACGANQLKPAPDLHRTGGMATMVPGLLVPQHHPHVKPPSMPSAMATGFLLYLLVWPICNAICLGTVAVALGIEWFGLGILMSFVCLGLLIYWHLSFIKKNELTHAKQSYYWRNSWVCLSCGQRFFSVDPDVADEPFSNY